MALNVFTVKYLLWWILNSINYYYYLLATTTILQLVRQWTMEIYWTHLSWKTCMMEMKQCIQFATSLSAMHHSVLYLSKCRPISICPVGLCDHLDICWKHVFLLLLCTKQAENQHPFDCLLSYAKQMLAIVQLQRICPHISCCCYVQEPKRRKTVKAHSKPLFNLII